MIVTRYTVRGVQMKLAVVADLHGMPTEELYAALRAERPDAILIPGDLFSLRKPRSDDARSPELLRREIVPRERALQFLRFAASVAPTFYSRGNHEWGIDDEYRAQVAATGAVLLENEWAAFGDVYIGGLNSASKYGMEEFSASEELPETDWLAVAPAGYKILLCHHPEYYPLLEGFDIDLIVAGHAHGGQWRVFGRGVFAPGQGLFPKYTRGQYGRMIVSAGLTNTTRIPRFFNPTELVVIEMNNE